MNYENNLLAILSWASTRSTWVSVSSCAEQCNIHPVIVRNYFQRNDFVQVARFYRYDYRIRKRLNHPDGQRGRRNDSTGSFTYYLSAVSRGYGI